MQSNKFGRQPVRFTGQHFTKSTSLIRAMISEAGITQTDLVLDIGAGKGALTVPLSKKAKKIIAVERDGNLAQALKRQFSDQPNVNVLAMDFRNMPLPDQPYKVVANIPYCITRDILGKLMDSPKSNFAGGTMVTEWGAALKLAKNNQASPRMVVWNTLYRINIMQKISANAFHPPPGVDSAMIKIRSRNNELISQKDIYSYASFVHYLLENHGVSATQALRQIFTRTQVKRIFSDLRIGRNALIQDLTPQHWAACFYVMKKLISKAAHPRMPRKFKRRYRSE